MIKKIILASCILLVGCSSSPEEPEFIYEDAYPAEIEVTAPQPNNTKTIVEYVSTSKPITSDFSPAPKGNAFELLDRNHAQVSKIYAETTKKVYLNKSGEIEEVEEEIIQEEPEEDEEEFPTDNTDYTAECVTYCGEGYTYSHDGEKLNGHEHICIKYPLPCGEECRKDWYIQELIYDTNYTCQEAIQKESNDKKEEKKDTKAETKTESTEAKK